jgi:adenosylcobinamide-GDP ribazoletransferase
MMGWSLITLTELESSDIVKYTNNDIESLDMKRLYRQQHFVDFIAVLMQFTRIKINWAYFSDEAPDLKRASWAFPLAGWLLGLISGALGQFLLLIGLPILLSCTIATAACIYLSGAYHEDGLADMADGFGAGGDSKKISNIIHDSRLGTYGVSTLIIAIIMRILLISSLVETGFWLFFLMGASLAVGKGFIMINRRIFPVSEFAGPATISFLGNNGRQIVCFLIWFLPCLFIFTLPQLASGITLGLLISLWCGFRAKLYIGGVTGDVLGATAFLAELGFLLGILILV